ncbi:hypothetical protein AQUCO_00100560v1 [Aquilegia coerulea]|uniref:Uncharacterized protein n=1 Tax=Aquilegia coerulea TaxID=218851 RepID=A0A2G5FAV5_AQUCA|nr:hypothetical protein AQUCO_00100560v1 [Aquilegia coerulea]
MGELRRALENFFFFYERALLKGVRLSQGPSSKSFLLPKESQGKMGFSLAIKHTLNSYIRIYWIHGDEQNITCQVAVEIC